MSDILSDWIYPRYRVSLGNIPTHKSTFVNFSYVQELNLEAGLLKVIAF